MPRNNRNLEDGGRREHKEALDNLVWYLSQRIKYPNGRKKTKFENFLNYDLGIPERRTEPLFGDDNIPNIFSSPVFTPSRPEDNVKAAIDATGKVIKEIGNQTRKRTSQGEPYIPHITFATGGRIRNNRRLENVGRSIYSTPDATYVAPAVQRTKVVEQPFFTPNNAWYYDRIFTDANARPYEYTERYNNGRDTFETRYLSDAEAEAFANSKRNKARADALRQALFDQIYLNNR